MHYVKDFLPPLFISFVARSSTVRSVAKSIRLRLEPLRHVMDNQTSVAGEEQ